MRQKKKKRRLTTLSLWDIVSSILIATGVSLLQKSEFWGWLLLILGISSVITDLVVYTLRTFEVLPKRRKSVAGASELDETVTATKEGIQELEDSRNTAIERLKELESQNSQDKRKIDKLRQQIAESDREINRLNAELDQIFRDLEIQRIQIENLKGSKDYFRISKLHAKASFIISVIACFVGLGLLAVAAYFAIREKDYQVAIVPAIGGAVANFIAATVFWVHNKSAQQLNRYYDSLHEIEVLLSSVKVIEKISTPDKRDEAYARILDELFNIQKIKAALPSKHTNPKDKEG